jgi:hypothetical protein
LVTVPKYRDPNGSGQKITLYIVTKEGNFYIRSSSWQMQNLGLNRNSGLIFGKKTAV